MTNCEELPIPSVALSAERSAEMLRVWIVDGDQVVTLSPHLWSDPGSWGLMLVDIARHVAEAYKAQGRDPATVLAKICEAMDAEWTNPTD